METMKLELWNSWDCEAVLVYKYVQRMETMKQGSHGYDVFTLLVVYLL